MNDNIDQAVHETRAFLAQRPAPDLRSAVMSRIENLEPIAAGRRPELLARLGMLLWAPREVSIRPAFGLAAAAALVALVVAPYTRETPSGAASAAGTTADAHVFVQFHLESDAAMRVQLAGSFTNWEPSYDLRQSAPGVWTITVPLTQGVHDYAFVVDGQEWVADPHAPQIDDGFGGTNSRLALLHADSSEL
jgi:hypothetical protein